MVTEINKLFAMIEDDKFYSVPDMMKLTGQSRQTIMNYIINGHISVTRYDMKTYILGRNFKNYLLGTPKHNLG